MFEVCSLATIAWEEGLFRYFTQLTHTEHVYAIEGMAEMGAENSLRIFRNAMQVVFGSQSPHKEQIRGLNHYGFFISLGRDRDQALDALTDEFRRDEDGLAMLVDRYARSRDIGLFDR